MLIRKFEDSDAEPVSHLIKLNYKRLLNQYYPEKIIIFFIKKNTPQTVLERSKNREMFVASDGDKIVGVAALKQEDVKTMFVHPDYQGKGIAKTLMEKIEDIAIREGKERIFADSSLAAVEFYEKIGFRKVNKIVSTLDGVSFEEIHMEKYMG